MRASRPDASPLTIFLVEVTPDRPIRTAVLWGGRVRQFTYDPATGLPSLPSGGSHKLIAGPSFEV